MIYSPAQHVEIRIRPSYHEIANSDIWGKYQQAVDDLITSREGSEYVRKRIAQAEIDDKLQRLMSLRTDWDSYGADAPSTQAVNTAAAVARAFVNFGLFPDAITPSPDGGVAICFLRNDKYADIECFNSGEIIAVRYSSTEDPKAWPIEPGHAASDATIERFSKYFFV